MSSKNKRGFTLIELMVVISVISLLASMVLVFMGAARAKGNDAATMSQVHEFQSALQVNGDVLPNPADTGGDATHYYCIGQSSAGTCPFWGTTIYGNDALKTGLSAGGFKNIPVSAPVVISGLAFNGYAYKCKDPIVNGKCQAAIYWTQSAYTPCLKGTQVYFNDGGRVCAEDAGTENAISNVDMSAPTSQYVEPIVLSVALNGNQAINNQVQHAMIDQLTINFNEPVNLDPGAMSLTLTAKTSDPSDTRVINSYTANISVAQSPDKSQAFITFTGSDIIGGSLMDGVYGLLIQGIKVHSLDNKVMVSDYYQSVYRLFDDVNGDRTVSSSEITLFTSRLNHAVSTDPSYWFLDYDGDGTFTMTDRIAANGRLGKSL